MIKASGSNDHHQLGEKSNNKDIVDGSECISPPLIFDINRSKLSSISTYMDHTVMTTIDGEAFGIGDNSDGRISSSAPHEVFTKFTKIDLRDSNGEKCASFSAVCGEDYTLYLVEGGGSSARLAYASPQIGSGFPAILDAGSAEPVALFGGRRHAAAIDAGGSVVFVPASVGESPSRRLELSRLPGGEKAVSVACLDETVFALSGSGRVFWSEVGGSQRLEFSLVEELAGTEIVHISGVCEHCLAVSSDGRVFGRGSNDYGCLCIGERGCTVGSFTLIPALEKHKIAAAYAGATHSLFQTREGKILACGDNRYGQLPISDAPRFDPYPVTETEITSGATFCIAGYGTSLVFVGADAARSPNVAASFRSGLSEENARLRSENAALKARIRDLEQQLESISKSGNRREPGSSSGSSGDRPAVLEAGEVAGLKRVGLVGRGSQSEVFKVAREELLALKVLISRNNASANVASLRQLLREFEVLNSLNHSNIIRAHGICFGDADHAPSILLDLCSCSLNDRISTMSAIEKVTSIYELSLALREVHSRGIIHRDVKPGNILFDSANHVKLSDFGIACIADVGTQTQSMTSGVGTLKFMAPELLRESRRYDAKVDVYSFGVVVFFILTGGDLPNINIIDAGLGKTAEIPGCVNGNGRSLISRCWSFDAKSRPSFAEIVAEIEKKHFKLIDGVEKHESEIKRFVSGNQS